MIFTLALASLALSLAEARPSPRGLRRAPSPPINRRATDLTWTLAENYGGSSFLDGWTFYTGGDPTNGQVTFVQDSSLAYYDSSSNTTILKVDDTTDLASGADRDSTRISSDAQVNENSIVIADFVHVPYGCATWPAFWLLGGGTWPEGGEIDIFEGVNLNTANAMTLHTEEGCTHDTSQPETGTAGQTDCYYETNGNTGCGVTDNSGVSYGDSFNNNGGGVWATLWDSDGISIWFFPRGSIPSDITDNAPDPTGWGTATGYWSFDTGDCSTSFFSDMSAVFDITLCGDWAGQAAVYSLTCSGTCSDEVETGSNFQDAYFSINYVQFWSGA